MLLAFALAILLQPSQSLQIAKEDMTLDGKKDEIMIQSVLRPVTRYQDMSGPPRFDVKVSIKSLGKYHEAGSLRNITNIKYLQMWVRKVEDSKVVKRILVIQTLPDKLWWAIVWPADLVHIPKEIVE